MTRELVLVQLLSFSPSAGHRGQFVVPSLVRRGALPGIHLMTVVDANPVPSTLLDAAHAGRLLTSTQQPREVCAIIPAF